MAKKNLWLGILVMVLVFGMTVAGCVSTPLDAETIATGSPFTAFAGRSYDSSRPLEEHSYVINFTYSESSGANWINKINGQNAKRANSLFNTASTALLRMEVIVLQPGHHTFEVELNSSQYRIRPVELTYTLEPGQYYMIAGGMTGYAGATRVEYRIRNLAELENWYFGRDNPIPTSVFIAGIDAAVRNDLR